MQSKKRWTCIGFLFVLLPVTAYAQMDLYELQQGRKEVGTERNRASFDFGGHVGLDVELSPAVSVRGGFGVSFTDFDSGFRIGLNFH